MQQQNSAFGMESTVQCPNSSETDQEPTMPLFDSRKVLWKNVSALMIKKYGRENLNQLAREAKLGPATASRIKAQDTSVGIDVIDRIASVMGVHPWQLLHENFDANQPDNSASYSALATDLAEQLDAIVSEINRQKAFALASNVIGLAALATEQPPADDA